MCSVTGRFEMGSAQHASGGWRLGSQRFLKCAGLHGTAWLQGCDVFDLYRSTADGGERSQWCAGWVE